MMKKFLPLILSFIFAVLVSCNKKSDDPPFPFPTQTGQNIVACKIDAKIHIYKFKSTLNAPGVMLFTYNTPIDSGTSLNATSERRDGMFFYIPPLNPIVGVVYRMTDNASGRTSHFYRDQESNRYVVDTALSSIVFTRFDADVAAGTFSFIGVNSLKDTVVFTEGWFDITRE